MNKVQVLVDDDLYRQMVSNSKESGLSLSAVTRIALLKLFKPKAKLNAIDQALIEIQNGDVEKVTVDEFKQELEELRLGHYQDKSV